VVGFCGGVAIEISFKVVAALAGKPVEIHFEDFDPSAELFGRSLFDNGKQSVMDFNNSSGGLAFGVTRAMPLDANGHAKPMERAKSGFPPVCSPRRPPSPTLLVGTIHIFHVLPPHPFDFLYVLPPNRRAFCLRADAFFQSAKKLIDAIRCGIHDVASFAPTWGAVCAPFGSDPSGAFFMV
jgi:hypothetical protein